MFGGAVLRLAKYAVAGAIALTLGTQLLTSVSMIVVAFRAGDIVPLLVVFIVTLLILRLAGSTILKEPARMIANVLGWVATVYLLLTVFVVSLDKGLLVSLAGSAAVTILCAIARNPSQITERLNESFRLSFSFDLAIATGTTEDMDDDEMWNYAAKLTERFRVLRISQGYQSHLIEIFQKRGQLPVSLTHLDELDILVVDTSEVTTEEVIQILQLPDTCEVVECLDTFTKLIHALPLIDARNGYSLSDYALIVDSDSVKLLIDSWMPRTTVFPRKLVVSILVPKEYATGLPTENIPVNSLRKLVLERKLPTLQRGEEDNDNT